MYITPQKAARATLAAAAAFTLIALTVTVHAAIFPPVGGRGDRAEEVRCPQGRILVGFHGRTGGWIDQIGLICATFIRPALNRGGFARMPAKGGNGGARNEQYCSDDGAIRQIEVRVVDEKFVWAVGFSCLRPRDGSNAGSGSYRGNLSGAHTTNFSGAAQGCTGSEYATGLTIRYGTHVNAIGLICGPVEDPSGALGNVSDAVGTLGTSAERIEAGMENNTDRPGSDIHRMTLQQADPAICQARCAKLSRCKAWTYVRPGAQGPQAICYLKDAVPQAVANNCCISGVKRTLRNTNPTVPNPPIEPPPVEPPPVAPAYPAPAPDPTAPRNCKSGFVWRLTRPTDYVCVTPESRSMAEQENVTAPSRWVNGAYGPQTCIAGFVWREAFDGDTVCVTPERRAAVKEENRVAPSRTE
jgi:hypothetical protein